jgi:hypothetical protein
MLTAFRKLTVLAALVMILCGGRGAGAVDAPVAPALASGSRTDADDLAAKYVTAVVGQVRAQAAAEALHRERKRLDSGGEGLTAALETISGDEQRALAEMVETESGAFVAALEQRLEAVATQNTQLVNDWRQVRADLYHEQTVLDDVTSKERLARQIASLLSVDNRWFWLFGLIAVGSLAAVAFHERRHEIRRWLYGGRARALGLSKFLAGLLVVLTLVTLTTFALGDRVYHWLVQAALGGEASQRQQFVAQIEAAKRQVANADQEKRSAETEYQAAASKWRKRQAAGRSVVGLGEQAEQVQQVVVRLAEESAVEATVAQSVQDDLGELNKVRTQIEQLAAERNAYLRQKQWIRGGLGLSLLGMAATGGVLFKRQVRRRQRKTRETCPLCLGQGTFEPNGDSAHAGLEMVRCKNVISEHPYEECDFAFSAMYRENVKLCFPTLGIPQAGKTHWLAMVYRELNRGNYPNVIQFERIRSGSSDDFDVVVDEILNKKLGPMATQVGRIPHPLIFNFLDRDRFGASNVLVNIFDYSGEVIRSQTIEDRQRQRALDGDGFFFFLDPTEPSETQSQALAGFREDLRRIKGLHAGKQVHVPIALCVSKIDLMVNQPYTDPHGGGAIEKFYRDLGELGWELNVDTIEARSKLMGQLRDTVWPGWQIERQIDDLFGGRFLFFPLPPVGLDGLGDRDLTRRTIAPVGLIEPLLWLLHMNGYPVLN